MCLFSPSGCVVKPRRPAACAACRLFFSCCCCFFFVSACNVTFFSVVCHAFAAALGSPTVEKPTLAAFDLPKCQEQFCN